jgi:hypothetical protein
MTKETEQKDTEAKTHAVARDTMVCDLRDLIINIMRDKKYTGKAWKDMSEGEQRDLVQRVTNGVQGAVIRAIDIVKTDGQKHIKAVLEQVTVKDGYKGVFKCSKNSELRHELTDSQGKTILVVLTDEEAYMKEGEEVEYDKDEPELPIDDEQTEDESHDETETKKEKTANASTFEREADELT